MPGIENFVSLTILDLVLLWLLVRTSGNWAIRAAAIIAVLVFNVLAWSSLQSFRGWPIRAPIPSNSIFLSANVDEPSEVANDPGHIDIWLIPIHHRVLLGYRPGTDEPRAYREPYSEPLERAIHRAQQLQQSGHGSPVGFKRSKVRAHGRSGSSGHRSFAFHPYILPPTHPLKKGS